MHYRLEHFGWGSPKKYLGYQIFPRLDWIFSCLYYNFASLCSVSRSYLIVNRFSHCCFFGVITECVFPKVVIMSSQPTVVAQSVVVHVLWGYVVGGSMISGTTQQCTINTQHRHCSVATHSGSYSTERIKEVHYSYTLDRYTKITVVHNIHSSTRHIHDTETFGLPEGQVVSTMILVLILSSTSISQCYGVVVRGAKKH